MNSSIDVCVRWLVSLHASVCELQGTDLTGNQHSAIFPVNLLHGDTSQSRFIQQKQLPFHQVETGSWTLRDRYADYVPISNILDSVLCLQLC